MPKSGYNTVKWLFGKEIEIPEKWKICNLGELLIKIQDGNYGESYPKESEFLDSGIPFIRGTEITKNFIDGKKVKYISKIKHDELKKAHIKTGDVLFMNRGGITRAVAIVTPHYKDANIGPQITLLRCNTEIIHNMYLYYFIQGDNFRKQVISNDAGTALQFFGIEKTKKFKITLPEIQEQQKIAAILSNVDSLIDSYDKIIESTKKLKKGLMQTLLTKGIGHKKFKKVPWLFGKEIEIPEEWNVYGLGEICNITKLAGFEYTKYWKESTSGEMIALRGINIGENKLDLTNIQKISKELSTFLTRSKLYKDNVLFPFVGSIGKAAIVPEDDKYHINQNVAKISDMQKIIPKFLVSYLLSGLIKTQIHFQNTSAAQPSVLLGNLRKFLILLPSISEQITIVSIFDSLEDNLSKLELKKKSAESLKKGLMQKLLTGQIRVTV